MTSAVGPGAPTSTVDTSAAPQRVALSLDSLARFVATALQFAVLVSISRGFEIGSPALFAAAKTLWIGWLVHHVLPMRFRLSFFAALSMALVVQTFGAHDGAILLGVGLALIGACHVPVRFGARLAIVAGLAAALVAMRAEWVPTFLVGKIPPRVWPILGSMFMFRLIAYLYDLKHHAAPVGPWRAAAYFFMAPNACFPLFPVVDYKGFVRSHFADETFRTYQIGLRWMWRGILQLLAYQVVYLFWVTDPMQAATLGDVAWYAVTTFLLYLRVSGLFHLIVGMLRMFGFALPETHHLYYLSSSFTDFWRRINIYWKEFLTKVVFYPAFVRLKRARMRDAQAMLAATLVAFAVTWFMHGYQLFWARGRFPITWQDLLFWFGLGGLVMVNMRWEASHGRKRRLAKVQRTLRGDIGLGARVAGTFASLCVLWAIWNTSSAGLRTLAAASTHTTPLQVLAIVAVLAAIGAAGVQFASSAREGTMGVAPGSRITAPAGRRYWQEAAVLFVASSAFLATAKYPRALGLNARVVGAITEVRHRKLNRLDQLGRERGYYQAVNDAGTDNAQVGSVSALPPNGWGDNPAWRLRRDILLWDYAPSAHALAKRVVFSTNRYGMRDREYSLDKPTGVVRIALLGASYEAGSGIPDGEDYESLLEERLNRGAPAGRRFEVLDFGVEGYTAVQKLASLEEKALRFHPDIILYAAHGNEIAWINGRMPDIHTFGAENRFPFLRDVFARAGVTASDAGERVQQLLRPYSTTILDGVLARLADDARANGARAAVLLVQKPDDPTRPDDLDRIARMASAHALPVLDLWGAFDGVVPDSIYLAPWDTHPNQRGHVLLAQLLERRLHESGLLNATPTGTFSSAPRSTGAPSLEQ